MSTGHTFHVRDGARDRARGVFFVSGRCRRRVVGGVFGSSTEEPNGGRHRGRKKNYPVLGFGFYVPSVICPGPIRLYPAQKDQNGVRATAAGSGNLLVWVLCGVPRAGLLIIIVVIVV